MKQVFSTKFYQGKLLWEPSKETVFHPIFTMLLTLF